MYKEERTGAKLLKNGENFFKSKITVVTHKRPSKKPEDSEVILSSSMLDYDNSRSILQARNIRQALIEISNRFDDVKSRQ